MHFLKRLVVWLVEVAIEALSLGLFLVVIFGHDPHSLGKDVLFFAVAIAWMFFMTGYLLTTAISRVLWKHSRLWTYPVLAMALFLIHFEILSAGVGGAFAPSDRLRIRLAGAFIVFACTFAGSWAIRLWARRVPIPLSAENGETAATASL